MNIYQRNPAAYKPYTLATAVKPSAPDLIDALAADHAAVRKMIAEVFDNPGRRRVLYPQIAEALRYHSHAEEQTLYAALGTYPQEVADIDRSYDEHGALDNVLRELDATPYGDEAFMERFSIMAQLLEQHLAPEESRVFAAARQLIAPMRRRDLGAQYERMMGRGRMYMPQVGESDHQYLAARARNPEVGLVDEVKRVLKNPTDSGRPRWHALVGLWSIFAKRE